MTTAIRPAAWLEFIEKEYLGSFVREGGAAIKFAVPVDAGQRANPLDGLGELAAEGGYVVAGISATDTRIHKVDEIFFRIAEQVSWRELSRKFIEKLAYEAGYGWACEAEGPLYVQLAERNQVPAQMLLLELKKAIGEQVLQERRLGRDFRMAMTHLCIAELTGGTDGIRTAGVLSDWLTGRNKAISAVKPYGIFRKINRSTARYVLESLVRWVRLTAYPGLVVLVDAERLGAARNPEGTGFYYTKAAVLDAYEVFRQFIDGADNLEGFFMAVVPSFGFLEDPVRGIGAYEALKFRVFDEVRDRNLVNPMAALARIAEVG